MTKQLQQQIEQVRKVQVMLHEESKLINQRMNEQMQVINEICSYLQYRHKVEEQDYSVPILTIGNDVMLLKQNVQAVNSKLIELERNLEK